MNYFIFHSVNKTPKQEPKKTEPKQTVKRRNEDSVQYPAPAKRSLRTKSLALQDSRNPLPDDVIPTRAKPTPKKVSEHGNDKSKEITPAKRENRSKSTCVPSLLPIRKPLIIVSKG